MPKKPSRISTVRKCLTCVEAEVEGVPMKVEYSRSNSRRKSSQRSNKNRMSRTGRRNLIKKNQTFSNTISKAFLVTMKQAQMIKLLNKKKNY